MKDRRKRRRKRPKYYLKVIDDGRDMLVGSMLDLSPEGVMIACREHIQEDDVYDFRMALPDAIRGERVITVSARAKWCNKDLDNDIFDYYSAGFEFKKVQPENSKAIESSMRNLLFMD